jgi:hypothetical protein
MEEEVKMTIYIPDDLAAEVKDQLGDTNISAICQAALRDELDRVKARTEIDTQGYERVVVYDSARGRDVAFQGKQVGRNSLSPYGSETAYVTPKGTIAVYSDVSDGDLEIYNDFTGFADSGPDQDLLDTVATALGEKYTEELDI